MILDASAVLAIMLAEPEYEPYEEAIADAPGPHFASSIEAGAVLLVRKGHSAVTLC